MDEAPILGSGPGRIVDIRRPSAKAKDAIATIQADANSVIVSG